MHEFGLQVIHALEKTISTDQNELKAAQKFLDDAAASNLQEFIKTLSEIIKYGNNTLVSREAACLQLKNRIFNKNTTINDALKLQWMSFPEDLRIYIKKNVLGALGTENKKPSAAAQCVAYIAAIELPRNSWTELIDILVNNVIENSSTENQKEASLDAIGYICREVQPEALALKSNGILTALVYGMRADETSKSIRLAAVNALNDSLEFAKANFEKENERHYIMQVVCQTTQCEDPAIAVVALQCLVKIVSLYYQYMELYMREALFSITVNAMKSDNDEIALQGIEFWSSISEEEIELSIEEKEAIEEGLPPLNTSQNYARGALNHITPILLGRLIQQDENDEDDWNPCKSASSCLMLLASCCGNDILPHVMPFVTQNVKNDNWKFRDASLMVLGAIIGGLDISTLQPFAEQALPILIEAMQDSSNNVKDSAAWGIGRICEVIPSVVINNQYLKLTLESLVNALKGPPRVATNACWAFSSLAEAVYDDAKLKEDTDRPSTTCLSQYFEFIIPRLLEATERQDANQSNLRTMAYEAIMELVKNSAVDCYITVQKVTTIIIEQLQRIILLDNQNVTRNTTDNSKEFSHFSDLKSLLCGTLQSVLNKVTTEDAPKISDAVMTAMLELLNQSTHVHVNTGLQEDAFLAISSLINLLGENFSKYLNSFMPYLLEALANHKEYQTCKVAVGVCGDIFREMRSSYYPYSDQMMTWLLSNLGNPLLDRSVKPAILSAFGDLAMNGGQCLINYFEIIMQVFSEAGKYQPVSNSYEDIDYINDLYDSILEAYSSVIHGLNIDETARTKLAMFICFLPNIGQLIQMITEISQYSSISVYALAGLIYDLCSHFDPNLLTFFDSDSIPTFLTKKLKQCRNNKTKDMIHSALKAINNVKVAKMNRNREQQHV